MIATGRWASEIDAKSLVFLEELSESVTVSGADGHHLERVRRCQPGDVLIGAHSNGTWRTYETVAVRSGELDLHATSEVYIEPELPRRVAVAFALTKGQKPETTVAQLTELGIQEIILFVGDHSQLKLSEHLMKRLPKVAREACMQCRRVRIPNITHATLDELAHRPNTWVATWGQNADKPERTQNVCMIVGPEGGFSPDEHKLLASLPSLSVGPFVLRADTAAIAVAACLVV